MVTTEPVVVILKESARLLLFFMQRAIMEGEVVGKRGDYLAIVVLWRLDLCIKI